MLFVAFTLRAQADISTTWNGTSGNWNDATRWSGGVFPNNAAPNFYDATINAGTVSLNQNITINQLSFGGGTLTGSSALTLLEGVQWSGGANLALTGNGTLILGSNTASVISGSATFSSGTILSGGNATISVQLGATFTLLDGANLFAQISSPAYTLSNAGTLIARNSAGPGFSTIDAVFQSTNALRVENTGSSHTLSLAGGGTLSGTVFLDTNTTLELGGTFTIAANTSFSGPGTTVIAGIATLGGANVSLQNLSVAVGQLRLNANSLAVAGNATIEDNGALAIEIRGAAAGQSDRLLVGGTLSTYGALVVSLGAGFSPALGDVFDVLDFAGSTGAFSSIQLPALPAGRFWRTDKLYSEGKLSISSVPATYTEWQTAYGVGAFTADDDKDGIGNGIEFGLGLIPTNGASNNGALSLPYASIGNNRLRLHFEMPEPGATDLTLSVEASDNFGLSDPWTTVASKVGTGAWTGTGTVTLVPLANGGVAVTVADTKNVSVTPKRFLRLKVERF